MRYALLCFLFAILACSINTPEVAADGKVRAGLSAGAGIAISFDAPSYSYTGSPRTVEATVTVSEPNARAGDVSVTGPGTITPNVFPVPPYSNAISVTLPAEVGEYTYTATAERENASPAVATTTVYVVSLASLTASGATEFDDGDGDENTKAYAVGIGTGDVTVTATPSPAIDESLLPYDWSLSGGTGSGKTTRTVSKATTGVTTITCTCGSVTKTVKIYVISVASLTASGATEYDDEDSEATTKAYATGIAATGDVTITATTSPATVPTAALTAAGWTLTGGTGTDLLTRTVTKTEAAKIDLTCSCGSTTQTVTVYVIAVDTFTTDATEYDDGDEDETTKAYASGIADEGDVTVTATTSPASVPTAALTTAGWTLTGGTGTELLTRTVTKTEAAKTDLTCSCGKTTRAVTLYVIAVDSLSVTGATVFDDGDGDTNTDNYKTPIAATGNVTVTAASNPPSAPAAALTAAGWSLTGGTEVNQLIHTVTKASSAITVVTCTCGSSAKTAKIYVYTASVTTMPSLCAGGKNDAAHKDTISVRTQAGGMGIPNASVELIFASPVSSLEADLKPSFGTSTLTTDENGNASTTLTSGKAVLPSAAGLTYATANVQLKLDGYVVPSSDTALSITSPTMAVGAYDPWTEEPVTELYLYGDWCDIVGESTFTRGSTTYNVTTAHNLTWRFKFWESEDAPADPENSTLENDPSCVFDGTVSDNDAGFPWLTKYGYIDNELNLGGQLTAIYVTGTTEGWFWLYMDDADVLIEE